MLFTDIEGSTALLTRLGDRYGEALSAQRAILRRAFSVHRGRELGTEGDGFFAVFESAGDAVSCCLAAQQALSAPRTLMTLMETLIATVAAHRAGQGVT